jgi:alkaline phosphatase D
MVFVWDDHDTADNSWRHGAKAHDDAIHGPWEDRLANATEARQEWLPCRLSDPADPLDMHRSFRLGDLLELVVLDTRIPGRDLQSGDEGAKALDDPERRIIPEAQMQWAEERIADRASTWALVASQVPVARLQLPIPLGSLVDSALPSGYRVIDGNLVCADGWDGYPVQRARLAAALEARAGSAVVVSGDVHSNWASLVLDPTGERSVAADFVTTAVSATAMGEQLPAGWRTVAEKLAEGVTDYVWRDLEHHGYLRIDVRPDELRGDWIAVDPGVEPLRPSVIGCWAVRPELPIVLRKTSPSSSVTSFGDVRRPGLPIDVLPEPEQRVSARRSFRARSRRAVTAAAVGVVVAGGATWLVRRRR